MKTRKLIVISSLFLASALSGCDIDEAAPGVSQPDAGGVEAEATAAESIVGVIEAETAAEAMAANSAAHDAAEDAVWDSAAVIPIEVGGDSITAAGDGVSVDGSKATITSAGTYSISGTLADGQIVVDTKDEEIVRLILNGADISSSTGAPIYIRKAEKAIIILADGTQNRVSDAATYIYEDPETDEPNAAIFSTADLTLAGNGSLAVSGNSNDGIAGKDGLVISGGSISVSAVDDGIRGKDYLVVRDGRISVTAQGDGLKSDNAEDETKGYVAVEAGVIDVTAGGDAIQAETDVLITGGGITLSAGGGSSATVDENTSAKGIKAAVSVNVDGGTLSIDSADDAINSNGSLVIKAGTLTLSSGDDGMHADSALQIDGGDIQIARSYEGIESAVITLNDGTIHILASDDGLNVAGGGDGSGMNPGWRPGAMPDRGAMPAQGTLPAPGDRPGQGDMPDQGFRPGWGGGPGLDMFAASGDYHLYINGGYVSIDATGDGIDVNGSFEMTAGTVLINGPVENMNGALDVNGSFTISGGFLVAAGSAGMAQAPGQASTQNSLLLNFDAPLQAGVLIHIQSSTGDDILTFSPTRQYQSIVLSSPELASSATYDVYTGGSSTGTAHDSLYQDGAYTSGTQVTRFTISGVLTRIGSNGFR